MVKIWLYRSGPMKRFSGRESWRRIIPASRPPSMKKMIAVTTYLFAIDLWLVDVSQPHNPDFSFHDADSLARMSFSTSTVINGGGSGVSSRSGTACEYAIT